MDWTIILSSALIILGALLMLCNILSHHRMMKSVSKDGVEQTSRTRLLINAHKVFMVFFALGYISVLYLFINRVDFASSLFVAIIFFFGAIFVSMGILIQRTLYSSLRSKNHELTLYNEALKQEQTRLTDLNKRLQSEVADRLKAEEADQLKSDFLSLVSHELRTPLTSIFGFTKLMEKRISTLNQSGDVSTFKDSKKRLADNLAIISEESCRLTRLVSNVLDLSKLESGLVDWEDKPTPLGLLFDTATSALKGMLADKPSVTLQLNCPTDLPPIKVDSDLFTQVLINLLSNAMKFTDSGVVSLIAKMESEGLHITITDEGEGISEENLEVIFDKFYIVRSGDTLGEKKQGTGLGLPICKQIIDHYNGRIWAESNEGKGSVFHIQLPLEIMGDS